MAKVKKNKNSYENIINALEKHLKKKKKKFLTQEEVFSFLDKKKLLVSEEGADELLAQLIKNKIISKDADKGDLDSVNSSDIGVELESFDDTKEIDLSLEKEQVVEVQDSELTNKLTETDDIVK